MDDFEPIKFGHNLWICPSWHSPPDPLATNIILDPGLAFGSGTHTTTSLCLRWLDQYAPQGSKVIDYGCGSGVLAIAAALLGAETVHAVDHDQQAIIATSANSLRNAIAKNTLKTYLPTTMPKVKADLLLANILAQPLIDLAGSFSKKLKPEGRIVLSGFLENQLEPITKLYNRWFIMDNPTIEKEWVLLTGTRRL
jgi:ribosomal protein L11 methyltransferase